MIFYSNCIVSMKDMKKYQKIFVWSQFINQVKAFYNKNIDFNFYSEMSIEDLENNY